MGGLSFWRKAAISERNKRKRLIIHLVLVFVLFISLIIIAKNWNEKQTIKEIIVTGNSFLPAEELVSKVDNECFDSTKAKVKLEEISKKILENEFVASVFVNYRDAETIEISIRERIPEALVAFGNGSLKFADKTGKIIPYRFADIFSGLIVVRPIYQDTVLDRNAMQELMTIVQELKNPEFAFLNNKISEIYFDKNKMSFVLITADYGKPILFGRLENTNKKFSKLISFYQNVFAVTNPDDVRYIDVRWDDEVTVKMSNGG